MNQVLYFRKRDYFLYKPDLIKDENNNILGIKSLENLTQQLSTMRENIKEQQRKGGDDAGLIQVLNEIATAFKKIFGLA